MTREHVVNKGEVGPLNFERGGEERKMSYGIGGAGNIRRPSDVIYPPRINPDGTRRRSSVWSSINVSPSTSPEGRRYSLMNIFGGRKGSVDQDENADVVMGDVEEERVSFNNVDLGGRKEGKGEVGDDE
ncbi:hypothetical protein BGZ60DRAFT_89733 [Tricladium varicosporioides]|nr:hypothetical protein BGZ60DRAFT_89733 [Hymenoscyphus varicosporioides]